MNKKQLFKRVQVMNECIDLAKSLNIKFRASELGLSIIGSQTKFFPLESIYSDNGKECKQFIKEEADPSLQTILF